MEIKVLKTFELTDKDWEQVIAGFNCTFDRTTTKERQLIVYQSNVFGYAYHAIGYEDDKVIAFTTILPYHYVHDQQGFNAGLNCSLFVLKEYRNDVFIYKDMIDALKTECLKEGFSVFMGVPNPVSHRYSIVFLGSKEIGYLPYYVLPFRVFATLKKSRYQWLDSLSVCCVALYCFANKLFSLLFNFKEKRSEYRLLITEAFLQKRFSAPCYSFYEHQKIQSRYRLMDEKGVKTAYLMDFRENGNRTSKALCAAIWHILRKERVDMVLFVGTLPMKQGLLFKIPAKRAPKPLPFTYNIIDDEKKEQFVSMSDLRSWDFSLMNFDGR